LRYHLLVAAVREVTRVKSRIAALLAATVIALDASAAESSPLDALRAGHADGIPWNVEVVDLTGKPLGTWHMRITANDASSCLGGQKGVRVEFARHDEVPSLRLGSYGVAMLKDGRIKIDLTGGMCDAYLMMEGAFAADGASSGDVYRFGMRGGQNLGTYRAVVK
jgi:hypothetical protein